MPITRRRAARLDLTPRAIFKGIQRGILFIETSNQAQQAVLDTPVDMAKAKLKLLGTAAFPGKISQPWQAPQAHFVVLTLTSPNTIRGDILRIPGQSSSAVYVSWELVEYR